MVTLGNSNGNTFGSLPLSSISTDYMNYLPVEEQGKILKAMKEINPLRYEEYQDTLKDQRLRQIQKEVELFDKAIMDIESPTQGPLSWLPTMGGNRIKRDQLYTARNTLVEKANRILGVEAGSGTGRVTGWFSNQTAADYIKSRRNALNTPSNKAQYIGKKPPSKDDSKIAPPSAVRVNNPQNTNNSIKSNNGK